MTEETTMELKPCPFCGKIPDCVEEIFGQEPDGGDYYGYWSIECNHTHPMKNDCEYDFMAPDDDHYFVGICVHAGSKDATIKGWNDRVESPEIPQWLREKIENLISGFYIPCGFINTDEEQADINGKMEALRYVLSMKRDDE